MLDVYRIQYFKVAHIRGVLIKLKELKTEETPPPQLRRETESVPLLRMGTMNRSKTMISVVLVLLHFCFSVLPSAYAISSRTGEGYTITGRVKVEGMAVKGFSLLGKLSNAKVILNGGQRVSFLRPDGYFSFPNVPAGTHLIEVSDIGYFFSPVRVDVSARNPGKIQAALTETRRGLSELVLEPLREEQYYEVREPFNIMSLVKSPMGMMVGFMVIAVFLLPKLMENLDPEEMKRTQEEMRNQGIPSLSSMLPGGAARSG